VSGPAPTIRVLRPAGAETRAVVLVLHGGQERSRGRTHALLPAYLRMLPFARDLHRRGRDHGVAVWLLRYRYRGWNAPDLDPVTDARWALAEIRRAHPDAPIALVGHSMGGRVGLAVAGEPGVVAVCALAPWTTDEDRVEQLTGRVVLIAHGDRDRLTDPADSLAYALRAKLVSDTVCRFDVRGEGHAMVRRARSWTSLVRRFVLGVLHTQPPSMTITNAMAAPVPAGLRVPL
jgi:dienelactone hydrolase